MSVLIGWFLSAYFLGGYSEDGRGMNGQSKAVLAAAKSWALGIPVSLNFIKLFGYFIFVNLSAGIEFNLIKCLLFLKRSHSYKY